ncbi:MAG TPA: zf-HC2 domain-containing protein [Bryobacteraceae bacterium]|jgi:hypothetical protein|nr:zf-HC2 domain-containing protein [Bryobacteraceae bacterium]
MNCTAAESFMPLYLTGELDTGEANHIPAREFAAHIQSCPACAGELSRQMAIDARVRAVVLAEPADTTAIAARVIAAIEPAAAPAIEPAQVFPSRRTWVWGLAAAAVLLAGLAIGYSGNRASLAAETPAGFTAAARDHRIEVAEGQPRKWRADVTAVADIAAREGIPASLVARLAPAGYRFQQGRLCKLDGVVYLHLVYADATGARRFSLYLDRVNQSPVEKVCASSVGAQHVAGFQDKHVKAMVVTEQSGDAALKIARFAASVI